MTADWLYLRDPRPVNLVSFWGGDPTKLLGPFPGAQEEGVEGFADISPKPKEVDPETLLDPRPLTVAFAIPTTTRTAGFRVVDMTVNHNRQNLVIELTQTPDPLTSGCTLWEISESAIANVPFGRGWRAARREKIKYDQNAIYDWSQWSLTQLTRSATGWTHEFARYYPPSRSVNHYVFRRCPYKYRDPDTCGYQGVARFTADNEATNLSSEDVCSKSISACELRFGLNPQRFGGLDALGDNDLRPVYNIPVFPDPEPEPDPEPPIPPEPERPIGPVVRNVAMSQRIFSGSGSWAVPDNIVGNTVRVRMWGAGGGGGTVVTPAGGAGGSPGGGSSGSAGGSGLVSSVIVARGGGGGGGGASSFGSLSAGGGGGGGGGASVSVGSSTSCTPTTLNTAAGGRGGGPGGGSGGASLRFSITSSCRYRSGLVSNGGKGGSASSGGRSGSSGSRTRGGNGGNILRGRGGDGSATSDGQSSGGGGGGAYVDRQVFVVAGQRIPYIVGAGGRSRRTRLGGNGHGGHIYLTWTVRRTITT